MSVVTNVVFDLGGVLLDWNPRHLYGAEIADPDELEHFLNVVCPLAWHFDHDKGRPFAETLPARAEQFPEHAELIHLWGDRYLDMISGPLDGTVAILEELDDAGVPLFALTNMPAEVWPRLQARYGFLDRLRGAVVSGQDRLVKPDPAIYRLLLDRYRLEAGATVFIDDVEGNAQGARDQGLHGIWFRDPDQLRVELVDLGLPLA